MPTKLVSAKFIFERETKGSLVFKEVDEKSEKLEVRDSKIGTLYLRKDELDGKSPKAILVEVSEVSLP